MKTIHVPASVPYDVKIGSGLLPSLGVELKTLCPKAERVLLVSDSAVFPLHGEATLNALRAAGFETETFVFPAGEASKTAETLLELLNTATRFHLTRSDAMIALGGGVTGDLTGFAAAVYMRGIPYIQVPTTLLSSVDSSVGGKTAVDLPAGKNLMGAFWQPRLVLCDTELQKTLPDAVFTDGCAEVIKTAVLFDPVLFEILTRDGKAFDREEVIARCVEHKRNIVAEDEFDTGRRGLLNLGHTLGHAVEACSDYALSHGQSVAIGTATVARAAAKAGLCAGDVPGRITALLEDFGLPTKTHIPIARLMEPMLSDKKRSGSTVSVIVPEAIGRCVQRPMDGDALKNFMESGL